MPGSHALLSPSSAHRWLHCTASPRLEEREEDRGSSYAEEGTLAHAYCARGLKRYLGHPTDGEDAEIDELSGKYHTGEMDEHVDAYRDFVIGKFEHVMLRCPDPRLLVETRLDFAGWIPGAFGTADAIIIADGTMDVIDFKYGKGVRVDAKDNPQMMIYALGAYDEFSIAYNIKKVRMTIFQPRLANISQTEMSVYDLTAWAESVLKPKAAEAWEGTGAQSPGDWCRFCKVRGKCKALARQCLDTAERYEDPRLITPEMMAADVLPRLAAIRTWVSDVEAYALEQALAGKSYEGWKVVEGRSNRRIADTEGVIAALAKEFDSKDFMKPRELRSITDLERLAGKRRFAELCGQYIEKPQGKPALVPADDKRPEWNSAESDFKDIEL